MEYVYIYNNSFLSLLTLISYLIKNKIKPYKIKDDSYIPNLLEEIINFNLEDEKNIINNINQEFGSFVLKVMYYVYLSNNEKKELIIYYLFRNSLKYRKTILSYRNLNCVNEALKIFKYVGNENHKLKRFLRFKELKKGILYAEMEPTNNIIELLSFHFKKRLRGEYWIIYDKKRAIYSIYDKKDFYLVKKEDVNLEIELDDKELNFESLWQEFYDTIGIKERKNDRCRMNFMPKKYWSYILEVRDEI